MYKLTIAVGLLALAAGLQAYQLFENDANVANIETKSDVHVDTVAETFRGNPNNALNITLSKQIIVHNIVEIIETLHLACVKTPAPEGGREVCRQKAQGLIGAGVNIILDVVELFDFLAFNRKKNPQASAGTAQGIEALKLAING